MPLVLRDMLLQLTYDPSLLHNSHVIGYSITGIYGSYINFVDKGANLYMKHILT